MPILRIPLTERRRVSRRRRLLDVEIGICCCLRMSPDSVWNVTPDMIWDQELKGVLRRPCALHSCMRILPSRSHHFISKALKSFDTFMEIYSEIVVNNTVRKHFVAQQFSHSEVG
ncbi:hypothetical protein TNCV_974281 [Trichonephila clavipes]|nr:hypothetical protein TNCV_974281 [Trichonephila clavipes]